MIKLSITTFVSHNRQIFIGERNEKGSDIYNIYTMIILLSRSVLPLYYNHGEVMIIINNRWRYDRGGVPRLGGEHPARPHGEERPRPLRGDA